MATREDPLFDLAVLLSYWVEPGDPAELHELRRAPSLCPGASNRAAIAARYFTLTGTPPRGLSIHLALARLRLAVAWPQLFRLYESPEPDGQADRRPGRTTGAPTMSPCSPGDWNPNRPLYEAGQHLGRAAQLDPHQRRPPTPQPGRPLLVEVARLVAYSRDPAQMAAIAVTVLLVHLLDRVAAWQQAQAAARRQLKLAADRMAEHALVTNHATGPATGQAPVVSQGSTAEIDHRRAGQAAPGRRHGQQI